MNDMIVEKELVNIMIGRDGSAMKQTPSAALNGKGACTSTTSKVSMMCSRRRRTSVSAVYYRGTS